MKGTWAIIKGLLNRTQPSTTFPEYFNINVHNITHIVRRMLDVDIPGKRRRGRPNLRWKNACKKDMTQAQLKEDNATNRAEWRKKLISYTGDPK